MSGEPKTHTPQAMTLGEALAAVRAKAKADGPAYMVTEVRFMPFAHYPWWVEMAYGDVKVYADWPPALSFALGVRVVARDEAAELRAALDAARDAMVSALAYHHHSLSNPVKEELNAAINRAGRALAGGESEK